MILGYELTYKSFGEQSILIEWPQEITKNILYDVLDFKAKIKNSSIKEYIEVNNAYCSLIVFYNKKHLILNEEIEILKSLYQSESKKLKSTFKLWKIPVCYDDYFGIDLKELSNIKGISTREIIKYHSQVRYTVYFIGFLPGFLYLGGLDPMLNTPRKTTPRLKIKKGAVAIGGSQTGVYPNESPGGWNIIGNSPIHFFDVNKEIPCFASPGDQIQFYPITKKEHSDINTLVEAGVYQIESEVIND